MKRLLNGALKLRARLLLSPPSSQLPRCWLAPLQPSLEPDQAVTIATILPMSGSLFDTRDGASSCPHLQRRESDKLADMLDAHPHPRVGISLFRSADPALT